jgi:hypothetical protein
MICRLTLAAIALTGLCWLYGQLSDYCVPMAGGGCSWI